MEPKSMKNQSRKKIRFWRMYGASPECHFGPILGAKMEPKSIKNRFKIRSTFQSDFGVVPGPFLVNFGSVLGSLNP